jgi:hypothetical protein
MRPQLSSSDHLSSRLMVSKQAVCCQALMIGFVFGDEVTRMRMPRA